MAPFLGWSVSLIQFGGGVGMLLGLFSRSLGVGLCFAMLGATWMTQVGPILAGGAPGSFGFLPPHEEWHPHGWKTVLWQAALAAMGASIALTGPGRVSLDAALRRLSCSARPPETSATDLSEPFNSGPLS
jgi:uncharacterized membrane protein YphA (DoxX/SURF4 family)